ncbi:host attachment family protein [Coralloluteibacterium thermophilus]|uniref:Host attachment family protein n=1 Tax=Coralloluteibacterium thermophilum TaxID=2707049 RepID=A0ABV9NH54_9GAMM
MGKIPAGTLVVVADGGQARVFRNVGDERSLTLKQEELRSPPPEGGQGPAGVMPPEVNVKEMGEATFAKQLAFDLNNGALNHRYAHLVLVADPQTLGQIRPLLHKETTDRLVCELAKTLTNAPLDDIERALTSA